MKIYLKKLLAYSSSASAFLFPNSNGNAQVVYHNIDPDTILNGTYVDGADSLNLDFNGDGITDIQIQINLDYEWMVVGELETYAYAVFSASIDQLYAVIKKTSYPALYGAENLASGFSINNSDEWNSLDTIKLFYYREYYGSIPYVNWFAENQYLGIKFNIGPETHFGWIRLSISNYNQDGLVPQVIVQDYAYELLPDTPLIIVNPTASIAEDFSIIDQTDYQNASDFKVQFNKAADESTVSAYRIFLYKYNYLFPTPPSVALLETLPPERYFEIAPAGLTEYESVLPASLTDINGDPILTGYPNYYRAIILSVADGVNVTQNNISLPSNRVLNELTPVTGAYGLSLSESGINCDITDFTVGFHKAPDEAHISEYRVLILNDDHTIVSDAESSFYQSLVPDGSTNYSVSFTPDKMIFGDSLPVLFQNYYTEIMTIGDSIYATIADFDDTRYDETYYGGIYGTEKEFYCQQYDHTPVISLIDVTKTPADIQVQFNGPKKISGLKEYRIFIVPEEDVAGFTGSEAEHIPWTNYFKISPPDSIIDVNLPADLPDINGNAISLDNRYVVVIGLIDKSIPAKFSVSQPSETFNLLSDEGNTPLPYSFIYDDILYVISGNDLPYSLNLYNMAGEIVLDYEITSEITLIDLSDLPKGVYIIKSKPVDELPIKKIFIGHSNY